MHCLHTGPTDAAKYTSATEWNNSCYPRKTYGADGAAELERGKELEGGNINCPFQLSGHGIQDFRTLRRTGLEHWIRSKQNKYCSHKNNVRMVLECYVLFGNLTALRLHRLCFEPKAAQSWTCRITVVSDPCYFPREFCSVIVVTVCIRPSADAEGLRDITHSTVACLLIQHFSAFKVITGDFTEHYQLLNSILIVLACCMEILLDTD